MSLPNYDIKVRVTDREILTPYGNLSLRDGPIENGQPTFLPLALVANGGARVSFAEQPSIRLPYSSGAVILTIDGYRITSPARRRTAARRVSGQGAKLRPYDELSDLVKLLREDMPLQQSLFDLQRDLRASILVPFALTGRRPPQQLVQAMAASDQRVMTLGQARPRGFRCSAERVTKVIEKSVTTWVDDVLTAAEQAAACSANCLAHPGLDTPFCLAACAVGGFHDLVVGTYKVVTTIFEEVVEEVWHCSAPLAKPYFPSLEGAVPLGADVLRQAATPVPTVDLVGEPWSSIIRCMSEGQWTVTMLDDLHVNIPGAEWVPFGVGVCLDRDCSTLIKDALLLQGAGGFVAALTGAVTLQGPIVAGLAAALGVSAAAVPGIVTGAVAVLGWHSLALGSQMAIWDSLGMAPRGYCLTYPTFPLMAAQVLLGPLLLPFAASIPVIAVPQ